MRTENQVPLQQNHLNERMQLIFNQESSQTAGSSWPSSRSSSSDRSYSSGDRSRSPSVSCRSRRRQRHGSRYSPSSRSSTRSRSHCYLRCCRASEHSRCRHCHQSRSYSPYPRRSSRYGRRRYSRSSSRERYYRRSRSRSSRYKRTGGFVGRVRCRLSPSPVRSYYRRKSKSPEGSVLLSQKDKLGLLNIARTNAAKMLGAEAVKLPASVRNIEEHAKKAKSDLEKMVRADPVPLNKPPQDEDKADDDHEFSRTSPARKPISFSVSNIVAKPSNSPMLHVTESKVTSRADSVGNRKPYGKWIPVKANSAKKR